MFDKLREAILALGGEHGKGFHHILQHCGRGRAAQAQRIAVEHAQIHLAAALAA